MAFTTRKVSMNTLGDVLKQARQSRGWDLKRVERKTGISRNYLEFLEADDFYKLPSSTYIRGALKRYAEFLDLDSQEIIKRFRHEFEHILTPDNSKSSIPSPKKGFNIKFIFIPAIIVLILFYLGFSIKEAVSPPYIEIIQPLDDIITKESTLIIEGKTELGIDVFINNQAVSQIDNGHFKQTIELLPGVNVIEISGQKKYSKKQIIYRRVVLEE